MSRPVGPRPFQLRVAAACDAGDDPLILLLSCSRQRREVIENNCIQMRRMLSSTSQPTHPDEVGAHDVIERAMQTLEECTNVPSVLIVWQSARHPV